MGRVTVNRIKRLLADTEGRRFRFRLPGGTVEEYTERDCPAALLSMVRRAKALAQGEEPLAPTRLELATTFGEALDPENTPSFFFTALPPSAYPGWFHVPAGPASLGEDEGLMELLEEYEE